jgi:hypothetical protein
VFGAAAAFVGWQDAIGINLSLESLEELLTGWSGPGAAIVRATP